MRSLDIATVLPRPPLGTLVIEPKSVVNQTHASFVDRGGAFLCERILKKEGRVCPAEGKPLTNRHCRKDLNASPPPPTSPAQPSSQNGSFKILLAKGQDADEEVAHSIAIDHYQNIVSNYRTYQ